MWGIVKQGFTRQKGETASQSSSQPLDEARDFSVLITSQSAVLLVRAGSKHGSGEPVSGQMDGQTHPQVGVSGLASPLLFTVLYPMPQGSS